MPGESRTHPIDLLLAGLATAAVVLAGALAFSLLSLPLLLASIGGSAVIVFGMPDSPMARARSLYGGHAVGIAAGFVATLLGRSDYAIAGADPIIVASAGAGPELLLVGAGLLALTHVLGLVLARLACRRREWQR